MIITNKYNLPGYLVRLTGAMKPPVPGRYSVTTLINSPYARQLTMKHWDVIEQDVSDFLWMIFGRMAHAVIEGLADPNSLAEEKLVYNYKGNTIVQIADSLDADGLLMDFKATSVYSFLLGEKEEWEQQLNLYDFGLKHVLNMPAKRLQIHALLRDWSKGKTYDSSDYPQCPFIVKDIPLWPTEQQELFLNTRLMIHTEADNGNVLPCTPKEMWEKPTVYKVKKNKDSKRAVNGGNHTDKKEAMVHADKIGGIVETVEGCRAKCKDYCPVRSVCPSNIYREKTNEKTA